MKVLPFTAQNCGSVSSVEADDGKAPGTVRIRSGID